MSKQLLSFFQSFFVKYWWLSPVFFITSILLGLVSVLTPSVRLAKNYTSHLSGYQFISPILDCEIEPGVEDKNIKLLRLSLEDFIKKKVGEKRATQVSIYYRDLNNGPTIGINEKETFAPASLLKVPVMMAYLKEAESKPDILNVSVPLIVNPDDRIQTFPPNRNLEAGKPYTMLQLIEQMIEYSDNEALNTLTQYIDPGQIDKVHKDLGLTVPNRNLSENFITVKEYASLFRVMYNATYLNREMSEQALKVLSQSVFEEGISKPIPSDISIAHKFGIRKETDINQLHDCGIIYLPNTPYLLCVMTKGESFDSLGEVIAEASSIVYTTLTQK